MIQRADDRDQEVRPAPAPLRRARWANLIPPLAYAAMALLLFAGAWTHPLERVIGAPGDPALFMWFLRWPGFALAHGMNPLFSDYLDYPAGVNLMWNVSLPLPALALTPVTLSLGPAFAYNLALTGAVALSGWFAFLAIRRHVNHPLAAAVGGAVYAFSPYLLSHATGHLPTSIMVVPPLMWLTLEETVVRQRQPPWAGGLCLGVLAAAQLLIAEEQLAVIAIACVLGIGLLVGMHPGLARRHAARAIPALAVGAATFIVLAAFPLGMQFFGPQRVSGALQPSSVYSNDLLNFVLPTHAQWLAPEAIERITARFTGYASEWNGYLGIPLLAVCGLIAVRFWERPLVRFCIALGTMLGLLSLGTVIHVAGWTTPIPAVVLALGYLPWRRALPGALMAVMVTLSALALAAAPLLHSLLPARMMMPAYLLAGLLLATFVDWGLAAKRHRWAFAGAAVLVAVSLFPNLPFPAWRWATPAFFEPGGGVSALPQDSVILVLPYAREGDANAMLWQAESAMHFRMPEGYAYVPSPTPADISPPPSATRDLLFFIADGRPPTLTADLKRRALNEWRAWHVAAIVVGPMPYENEAVAVVSSVLARPPEATDGVYLWLYP